MELLVVSYLICVTAVAVWSHRRNQSLIFGALGEQPDAPTHPTPRPQRNAAWRIGMFTVVFVGWWMCTGLFDSSLPQKFCVPERNCWSTGREVCERKCLLVDGVLAVLPIDDRWGDIVALREFTQPDGAPVWSFERYTADGEHLVTSFHLHGRDHETVWLKRLNGRNVTVQFDRDHALDVRLSYGRGRDVPHRLVEYTDLNDPALVGPVDGRSPIWRGNPGELTRATTRPHKLVKLTF